MAGWTWPNGGPLPPQVPNSMYSTEEYGWRTWTQPARMHWGIDLYINDYQIRCAADGTVTARWLNGGAGNEVVVLHDDGSQSKYKHLAYFAAGFTVGSRVTRGQVLGRMGTTGDSTGDHLHFEVRDNPSLNAVEPRAFMAARTGHGLPGSSTPISSEEPMFKMSAPNRGVALVGANLYVLLSPAQNGAELTAASKIATNLGVLSDGEFDTIRDICTRGDRHFPATNIPTWRDA